jgi:hypothetical protein
MKNSIEKNKNFMINTVLGLVFTKFDIRERIDAIN